MADVLREHPSSSCTAARPRAPGESSPARPLPTSPCSARRVRLTDTRFVFGEAFFWHCSLWGAPNEAEKEGVRGLPPEVLHRGRWPGAWAAAGAQLWGLSRPADGGTRWLPLEGTCLAYNPCHQRKTSQGVCRDAFEAFRRREHGKLAFHIMSDNRDTVTHV